MQYMSYYEAGIKYDLFVFCPPVANPQWESECKGCCEQGGQDCEETWTQTPCH